MALPNSGPLSLSSIQGEFGGSNPISLSEYYRGGPLVASLPNTSPIPSSGAIAVSNFYGTSASVPNNLNLAYRWGYSSTGGKFPTNTYSPNISGGNWNDNSLVHNSVPATVSDHRSIQTFLTFNANFNFTSTIPAAFFSGLSSYTYVCPGTQINPAGSGPQIPYSPTTVNFSISSPSSSISPMVGISTFGKFPDATNPNCSGNLS